MDIDLPLEVEEMIKSEVASGRFASAGEALAEAMRVWQIRELRDEIAQAEADFERGDFESFDENSIGDFVEGIRARRLGERP